MSQSINLIPQEEKHEQVKTEAVKFSTIFTLILMVIVILISGYFFFQVTKLKSESKSLDNSITQSRNEIQALSAIEINARNLDARYKALTSIYSSKNYFSKLLEEVKVRIPSTVTIKDMNITTDNKASINGDAENYMAVSAFINKLLENKTMFTDVTLNSVSLNSTKNRADFFIVVSFNPGALK